MRVREQLLPKYNVKLQLDDELHNICLDVYQRVESDEGHSEEEIVEQAKRQFKAWAEDRGPDWEHVAVHLPSAEVTRSEVQRVP
jgi:hypothetical protein